MKKTSLNKSYSKLDRNGVKCIWKYLIPFSSIWAFQNEKYLHLNTSKKTDS